MAEIIGTLALSKVHAWNYVEQEQGELNRPCALCLLQSEVSGRAVCSRRRD